MKKLSFTQMRSSFAWVLALAVFSFIGSNTISAQDQCVVNAASTNTPIAISLVGGVNYPVTCPVADIPADEMVVEITVDISIDHSWSSDLEFTLDAPNGASIFLGGDECSADDWIAANVVTYSDAGAAIMCANPLPAQIVLPDNLFSSLVFANTSELNGDWVLNVFDDAGGDDGVIENVTVNITTTGTCGAGPPPVDPDTCAVTCPTNQIINLDPGLCCQVYNWEIGLNEFCGNDATEGFTGAFSAENTNLEVNTPTAGGGLDCPNSLATLVPDELFFCSSDGANFGCPTYIFTIYAWEVPEDGTVTFDWDYNSDDSNSFWDPFGFGTIVGPNIFFNPIHGGVFGPTEASGTYSEAVTAGSIRALYMQTQDLFGGSACVSVTNFTFTPAVVTEIVQIAGPEQGTCLEIGTTDFGVEVYNDGALVTTCEWSVQVNGFNNPTTTLACNDLVQVSVDENCNAFIGADMILEGGPYACYDGYLVAIEGYGENLGGMMIDGDAIDETLTVTVTDTLTGNSCWGEIYVEDKLPPMITCFDVELPCGVSTDPVFTIPQGLAYNFSEAPGTTWPSTGEGSYDFEVPVTFGLPVSEVTLAINLNHTWTGDLVVSVTSPDGSITPIDQQCGNTDDWDMTLDDDGVAFVCLPGIPVLAGTIMPSDDAMSGLDGGSTPGTWNVTISDGVGGDGCTINSVALTVIYGNEAAVGPPAAYAPITNDNCGDVVLTYEDAEGGDECDVATIERTWTATDESGNTATCIQLIEITPLDLGDLECPVNYVGDCDDDISPENTGYPTVDGNEITGGFCNIFLDYWDKPLPACGNGSKIIRTWTILDWCTQETVECIQIIKLESTGPGLICPDDQVIGADPWTCETDANLVPPTIDEVCGGTAFTLVPTSSNGTIIDFGNGNYRVDGLPLGETIITWSGEDECGAEASCSYTITVIDDVPPVALCDLHTIVSLTFDNDLDQGLTKVPASVFDDGSYDNCTDVTFTAARMTSCIDFDWTTGGACVDEIKDGRLTSTDRGVAFRPCVPFACCDVAAGPIMVQLRVEDEFGNVNSCMVEIEVQDKLSPFITAPPDIWVSCDFWFAANETSGFVPTNEDVMTPIFGDVLDAFEFDQSDRQDIIIDDPGNDELPQPYNWGIDGFADDNCDVDITVNVRIEDDCSGDDFTATPPHPNAVRLITRTFRARDAQGNFTDARQRVWVIDFDPFYISDDTCVDADRNDGVKWPCDEDYDFCPAGGIDPTYPEIFDDNCSLIGVTFEDTRFDFVDGACYKILREWTVIDWCQYDGQGAGLWTYVQVIKVIDSEPTFILGCPIAPVTASVLSQGINVTLPDNNQVFLGEDNPLATSCTVHVNDTLRLSEFCSGEVTYDVKIFPNNGPDFLQIHKKKTVTIDTNGFADAVLDTRTSDILGVRLNGLPYNSNVCSNWPLPGGDKQYHRVLWTVEDGCGNVNTCEYLLRLEDKKAPSPVCVGLSSVVMPSSGEVTIWAKDFNASSFDDCTPAADLLYSFSGDTYEPSRSFTCADLEANGSPSFIVEIYVADQGNDDNCNGFRLPNQNMGITDGIEWSERNKDFCTTFIVIDDNEGVCGNGGSAGGVISTEELEPVEKVFVNLKDNNGNVVTSFTTTKDGIYHFINPLLDLDIEPVRNDDHKNGVSTLDLVKIQKHLLGIEDLGSPFKLIAADANNSSSVSAIDLVELRKLILGLYTELPNNASWRFADENQVFADEANPWDFVEVVNIQDLAMNKDFVAIKIGDVNGTVSANSNSIETRNTAGALKFQAVDQTVQAGEEVLVDVTSADFNNIIGYQFTMQTAGLKLTDVVAGSVDMGIENVGVHKNSVTASWHRVTAVSAEADDVLFTLAFTATQAGQLSEMLNMNSRLTQAEAYNESEEILDVAITFTTAQVAQTGKDFALFQNSPNPFNGETVIAFTLPEAMEATLTVFDVTGKVVYLTEGDYAAGYNNLTVSSSDLSATGVLYYRLDADDFTATKKMVLID